MSEATVGFVLSSFFEPFKGISVCGALCVGNDLNENRQSRKWVWSCVGEPKELVAPGSK